MKHSGDDDKETHQLSDTELMFNQILMKRTVWLTVRRIHIFNLGLKKLKWLECFELKRITTQSSTALFSLRRENYVSFEHNTARISL